MIRAADLDRRTKGRAVIEKMIATIKIAGKQTGIYIETALWNELRKIADARDITASELVAEIAPTPAGRSAKVRAFILDQTAQKLIEQNGAQHSAPAGAAALTAMPSPKAAIGPAHRIPEPAEAVDGVGARPEPHIEGVDRRDAHARGRRGAEPGPAADRAQTSATGVTAGRAPAPQSAPAPRRQAKRRVDPHRQAQDEQLRRLWSSEMSTAEIAQTMGLGKNQIIDRAHRLHLERRPNPVVRGFKDGRREASQRTAIEDERIEIRKQQAAHLARLDGEHRGLHRETQIRKGFDAAAPRKCQFPMWSDDEKPNGQFCGAKSIEGKPYCDEHSRRCYTKPQMPAEPIRKECA